MGTWNALYKDQIKHFSLWCIPHISVKRNYLHSSHSYLNNNYLLNVKTTSQSTHTYGKSSMNVITVLSKFSRTTQSYLSRNRQVSLLFQRLNSDDSTNKKTEEHPPDDQYEQNIRLKILDAALPFVLDVGWSQEALVKGAESLGYPGITHGVFLRGGGDLVHHFYQSCNQKLVLKLKEETQKTSNIVPSQFIQNAVEARLRMIVPYKSKWPQAIAIMTLPPNVPTTLANLLTLVDDICYYAGDRSVDFKWYSRRIALGALYKATELYLVQDKSADHQQTWDFLSRRIVELFQMHDLLKGTENLGSKSAETFSSAFSTARNMLGVNWTR